MTRPPAGRRSDPRQRAGLTLREIAARLAGVAESEETAWLEFLAGDPRVGVRRLLAQAARRRARIQRERDRLNALYMLERARWAEGFVTVAGVDEAGVGPLAGPVVAAAVVLPGEVALRHLNDSKVLLPVERQTLFAEILACGARVGVGVADVVEIDRLNILQATRLAWRRAVTQIAPRPHYVLVDGRYRVELDLPQSALVDGDARCASIAAASIVAKVTRDRIMEELDARYPEFGFAEHKGYATPPHLAAIRRHGFSPVHRRTFLPLKVFQGDLFEALA